MENFLQCFKIIVTRRGFFAIFYFVYPANAANSASTACNEIDKFILRQFNFFKLTNLKKVQYFDKFLNKISIGFFLKTI